MRHLLSILGLIMLSACATAPRGALLVDDHDDLPSAKEVHADILKNVRTGMTLEAFRKVFPKAYPCGQSGDVTAYEFKTVLKYVTKDDVDHQNFLFGMGSPAARSEKSILWFYFYQDLLVRWGSPNDWPAKPDLIIEHRER